jgi:hypothetical protein
MLVRTQVILNDIHIDIMDYITPAHCSLLQFRQMWAEFEWENKVSKLLSYLNLLCLAPPLRLLPAILPFCAQTLSGTI